MVKIENNLSDLLVKEFSKLDLKRVEVALEHETIRVLDGKISPKNHPTVFEPKQSHKFITTDFSESQMEFITPVHCTSNDLYNFSNTLYDISALEIEEDELLWAYSMPCKIEDEKEIREALFNDDKDGKKAYEYRLHLTNKYGKKKQTISGIHFNFSLCDKFINKLIQNGFSKNDIYLKIIRNYKKYKFLTVALLGATPVCDESLFNKKIEKQVSIRSGSLGYRNLNKLNIDYSSVESFIKTVESKIQDGTIIDERELYETIRIKTKSKALLNDLKTDGIKYVELRNIDINPYEKGGISVAQIELLKYIIFYCLIKEETNDLISDGDMLNDFVAENYDFNTPIPCMENKKIIELLKEVLNDMLVTFKKVSCNVDTLEKYIDDVNNDRFLYKKVYYDIEANGYDEFLLDLARKYKEDAYNNRFKLYGFEDMELSTQILMKESIKYGIDVSVVDIYDNFIKLGKNDKVKYIKQATKTSLDNYATVCAMENKVVTKKILDERGIKVPKGSDFLEFEDALNYAKNLGRNFVVKPKSTNFGLGINIFKETANFDDMKKAIEIAFSYDKTIIIEEYIEGEEYRFLVIGDKTVGVLNRVPANVCGDGKFSIKELVEVKNKDSLRGVGYKTPLEKIKIDDNVKIFLNQHSLDENYIPKENEVVYLRQNSNVSTGGDSIDLTDEIHEKFKQIAVEASKAIGANICGVDIIVSDYKNPESNYSIIELNFNPAIHIHSYPYKGKERKIAKEILSLLKFI